MLGEGRTMNLLSAVFLMLLSGSLIAAETIGVDIDRMTPGQIANLDVYVVMRHITKGAEPGKKFDADAFTTILIKKHLAMLLYPVNMAVFDNPDKDPKFKDQIRELQKRMGVMPTGVLLQGQFDALTKTAKIIDEPPVYPPAGLTIIGLPGLVVAKGTWVMEGDAFPVNYNEITCTQSTQVCTEVSVNVVQPNQLANDSDYNLIVWTTDFKVASWDSKEVSAINETQCRRERLTINTSSKQAFHISTDKSLEGCKLLTGETLPLLGKPRLSTLGDGFQEPKKIYEARKKQAQRLLYEPATKALGKF